MTAQALGAGTGISVREGPWLYERDFDSDPTLHARGAQTVLLELEQGSARGGRSNGPPGLNTHRLLVEETRSYRFCIPADEPHITRLKIREGKVDTVGRGKSGARGKTVVQVRPGDDCEVVSLDPGSYVIETHHDHRNVPPGQVGFVHLPGRTNIAGDPGSASSATFSFMAWKGPDGGFVTTSGGEGDLTATATTVDEYSVWRIDGSGDFLMTDGLGGEVQSQAGRSKINCPPTLFIGPERNDPNDDRCDSRPLTFRFDDSTSTQFRLVGRETAYSKDGLFGFDSGFSLGGANEVASQQDPTDDGILWSVDYRGFTCASGVCDETQLTLQKGEVALFARENFEGPAIVFAADVPDFSIYDLAAARALAIGDNQVASVRVGPNTRATLYTDAGFGGPLLETAEDIPSLSGLTVGLGEASSLDVEEVGLYAVSSNGCPGCDLTGVDLSGQDFASANFTATIFTGANLTGTILLGAALDDAIMNMALLGSTDFRDASLRCTDLSDTDVTTSLLSITSDPVLAVTDSSALAVFGVDPLSGGREIISGPGKGEGVALQNPVGIARAPEGVFITDRLSVLQIVGGDRTVISSVGVGSGPRFRSTTDLALAADGSIVVLDGVNKALVGVDPATGNRTILSSPQIGTGPSFQTPFYVAVSGNGTAFVGEFLNTILYAVDLSTGDRRIIAGPNTGSGESLLPLTGVEADTDGSALVTTWNLTDQGVDLSQFLRIDPVTLERTLISGTTIDSNPVGVRGDGPDFSLPRGPFAVGDGTAYVADSGIQGNDEAIFLVDLATGDRTLVTGGGVGVGPSLELPQNIAFTDTAALEGRIATDFSCRLNLARSTLGLESIPPALWRYADLRGVTINGLAGAILSSAAEPLDLSGAILNGANLSGAVLDSANLGCATVVDNTNVSCLATAEKTRLCTCLQGTDLNSASMRDSALTDALLQGALLLRANLDSADMSGAQLLALTQGDNPANISGAFMRAVSLQGAKLTGVLADNVNFFTSFSGTADASNADLTNAKFNNAYLAGANFADATAQSSEWNQAVLAGANFTDADLRTNSIVGVPTDFTGAYLQGAVFLQSKTLGVNFPDTYWDFTSVDPMTAVIQLPTPNLQFAGYWNDPADPECVTYEYIPNDDYGTPDIPATDSSNVCPDGLPPTTNSSCTFTETPITPIEEATPKSSICTTDDVNNMLCPLPLNPGNQCTFTDIVWSL